MRAYIGVTASEVQEFLQSGEFDVSDAYAATHLSLAIAISMKKKLNTPFL